MILQCPHAPDTYTGIAIFNFDKQRVIFPVKNLKGEKLNPFPCEFASLSLRTENAVAEAWWARRWWVEVVEPLLGADFGEWLVEL